MVANRKKEKQPILVKDDSAYPYNQPGDIKKRYSNVVFWAKMQSYPWWPVRECTPDELKQQDVSESNAKYVCFLGDRTIGKVKKDQILPYAENFNRFCDKAKKASFQLALEEADETVLRHENDKGTDYCMICLTADDPDSILLCDRCDGEVHMHCLTPSLHEIPEDDFYCPSCIKYAPLTIKMKKGEASKKSKKEKNSKQKEKSSSSTKKLSLTLKLHGKQDSKISITPVKSDRKSGKRSSSKKKRPAQSPKHAKGENGNKRIKATFSRKTDSVTPSNKSSTDNHSKSPKSTDDFCFICGDGGNVLVCDFENCPKVYHTTCLGSARPDPTQPSGARWFCPWHTCSACGLVEQEPKSISSIKQNSKKARDAHPRFSHHPPPLSSFSCIENVIPEANGNVIVGQGLEEKKFERDFNLLNSEEAPFIRCTSCPLAFCKCHYDSVVCIPAASCDNKSENNHDETNKIQIPVRNEIRNGGYFACLHCKGYSLTNNDQDRRMLPNVGLVRCLSTVWSRVVNGHHHLLSPFMYRGSIEGIDDVDDMLPQKDDNAVCLDDIRIKLWNLKYPSLEAYVEDYQAVVNCYMKRLSNVSDKTVATLIESLKNIPLIVEEVMKRSKTTSQVKRTVNKNIEKFDSVEVEKYFSPLKRRKKLGEVSNQMYVWDQFGMDQNIEVLSPGEWANFLCAAPIGPKFNARGIPNVTTPNYYLGPRHEVQGIAALINAATIPSEDIVQKSKTDQTNESSNMDVTTFRESLPPSRGEIEHMIFEQSRILRSAVQSHAKLRCVVQNLFQSYEGESDSKVYALGEGKIYDQYKSDNEVLQNRVAALQKQVQALKKRNQELSG